MIIFFYSLVLIFILSFNEIEEAAGMFRKILPKPSKKDQDKLDSLATPRLPPSSSATLYPSSIAHEALNLDGYNSHPAGSFHQESPTDVVHQFRFKNGLPPQVPSSPKMVKSGQTHHQLPECSEEYPRLENIEWLLEQCRKGTLPLPQQALCGSHELCYDKNTNAVVEQASGRPKKNMNKKEEKAARKVLDEKLLEAKRRFHLPFSEHKKLIQQGPFKDKQPLDYQKIMIEKNAVDLYNMYYPADFTPTPQPDNSLEIAPPALHEIDRSLTKGGYKRKENKNKKGKARKDVASSSDYFS